MTPDLVISIIACAATLLGSLALVAHRAGGAERQIAAVEKVITTNRGMIDALKLKQEDTDVRIAVFVQKLHDTCGEQQRAENRSAKSMDDLKISIEAMAHRMNEVAVSLAKIETAMKAN